jgi:hypothetical protein
MQAGKGAGGLCSYVILTLGRRQAASEGAACARRPERSPAPLNMPEASNRTGRTADFPGLLRRDIRAVETAPGGSERRRRRSRSIRWRGRDEIPHFFNALRCIPASPLKPRGWPREGCVASFGHASLLYLGAATSRQGCVPAMRCRRLPNRGCFTRRRRLTGTFANERACAENNGRRKTVAPTCSARSHIGSRSGGVQGCAAVRHNYA